MPGSDNSAIASGDPTPRTTAALSREISMLRELLETRLEGRINTIVARLDAADKAIELLQTYPTDLDKTAARLKELFEEKFDGVYKLFEEKFKAIEIRFGERDIRFEQAANDRSDAIKAAFASSQAAVTTAELNTKEKLGGLERLFQTKTGALDEKAASIENRIVAIESRTQGITAQRRESRDVSGYLIGAVVGVGGLVIAAVALLNP